MFETLPSASIITCPVVTSVSGRLPRVDPRLSVCQRVCPIMCNLQSDRPRNRQRKEKSVHNLICKNHIKLETESLLWTEILVLQVTRFRRFLKCDVGEKHWGAILISFWPIRLKRRATIPPFASLLLNRRTYIPLVNTISQERFEGFSSNFAQMSTLTWEWTD